MTYVAKATLSQAHGRREMSGGLAIRLAEKAHREGRFEEARGLVELAYRLFDEAADLAYPTSSEHMDEFHHA